MIARLSSRSSSENVRSSVPVTSTVTGDPQVIYRVALRAAFLVVTTPISAFVIARAAYLREEPMRAPDPVDESGKLDTRSP